MRDDLNRKIFSSSSSPSSSSSSFWSVSTGLTGR